MDRLVLLNKPFCYTQGQNKIYNKLPYILPTIFKNKVGTYLFTKPHWPCFASPPIFNSMRMNEDIQNWMKGCKPLKHHFFAMVPVKNPTGSGYMKHRASCMLEQSAVVQFHFDELLWSTEPDDGSQNYSAATSSYPTRGRYAKENWKQIQMESFWHKTIYIHSTFNF